MRDLEALYRLEPLVVFDRHTLETRYRFRADQAIHVIGVRTYRLARPATVTMTDDYAGCRSWVSLDEEIDVEGSVPALPEGELAARLEEIDQIVGAG